MLFECIASVAVLLAFFWINSKDTPPIAGVYQQKGKFYYVKYCVCWFLLKLRSLRKANSVDTGETAGYGVSSKGSIAEMEKVQVLPDPQEQPMAVDAVYFCASNKDGYYLVTATARRQNGMIQVVTFLRIPSIGLLELPLHPRTLAPETKSMMFAAEGLTISPLEPMKRWKISFDGLLRHTETLKEHHVKFDLDWMATGPHFDFDTDMNPWVTCDSMAREKWSKDWFKLLKTRHQTHHEQFGRTEGQIEVEGYGTFDTLMEGLRDHSYGNIREWQDLFRYGLQYVHLEDGTNIAVGLICMPKLLSRVTLGYVVTADQKLVSISGTDFEFHKWGDDGTPPPHMTFTFTADGKKYEITCTEVCSPVFYMRDRKQDGSWDVEGVDCHIEPGHGARIHERLCTFSVNGVPGTGISEWCYENIPRHQVS